MVYHAKSDEMQKLAAHPDARRVHGESGIEYLSLPEVVLSPSAVGYQCPITGSYRYREVLVAPQFKDGSPIKGPHEE